MFVDKRIYFDSRSDTSSFGSRCSRERTCSGQHPEVERRTEACWWRQEIRHVGDTALLGSFFLVYTGQICLAPEAQQVWAAAGLHLRMYGIFRARASRQFGYDGVRCMETVLFVTTGQ